MLHFCHEEAQAIRNGLQAALPFLDLFRFWARAAFVRVSAWIVR